MSQWLRDERGLLYFIEPDGSRFYNAPSLAESRAHGNHDSFLRDEVWDTKTGTYKKKTNWNNVLTLMAGGAIGAGALSGALGGGGAAGASSGAAGAGATTAVPSMPWTIPAGFSASMGAAPPLAAGAVAAGAGAGTSIAKRVADFFTKGSGIKDVASLAAILPMLRSGGGSGGSGTPNTPFADLQGSTDVQDAYALQKRRTLATQPAFDALVNQAYGMTPTRYRGAAPDGTPAAATEPVSGPYVYRGPQFG